MTCEVCLVKSYSQEHINENFRIRGHNTSTTSLFDARQNFKFIIFVMILPALTLVVFDESQITSWYCRCRTGSRVIAMCVHIASVLQALHLSGILLLDYYIKDWNTERTKFSHNQRKLTKYTQSSDSSEDWCVLE